MNTELIEISATRKEIRIEVPPEEVRSAYDAVSRKYAGKAQVPGFRKGLAPLDVVRLRYKEEIKADVIQKLLPEKVAEAIRDRGLNPLTEPQLHLEDSETLKVNGSQPLVVRVGVQVMPEVPVPEYEGIEVTRRVRKLKDAEIDNIIEERRQEQSTFLPVEDRASADGDMVIVDLKGTFRDEPEADPIEVNDLEVQLGDDLIEKSFTENLVGVRPDDDKEFTVEYPDEFSSPALAGRTVDYNAKVKAVGQVEFPDLTDEWVQSLDEEISSVSELRKHLREHLQTAAESEAENRLRSEAVAKLIAQHDFEVPDALIDSQAQTLLNNFAGDLSQRGVDVKKLEQSFIETTYKQMRGQAERDVRGAMLLEKLADLEGVEVSDEDVQSEIESMSGYYEMPIEEMRKMIDQQGGETMIQNNLRTRKAVEALVAKANITEGEWKDGERESAGSASGEAAEERKEAAAADVESPEKEKKPSKSKSKKK